MRTERRKTNPRGLGWLEVCIFVVAVATCVGWSQTPRREKATGRPGDESKNLAIRTATDFCAHTKKLDESCVQNAIAPGVKVYVPAGTYKASHTVLVNRPNVLIEFDPGVVWILEPADAISRQNNNDRAFFLHNDDGFSPLRKIDGQIKAGDLSFSTTNGKVDTTDLIAGSWIFLQETDPGLDEIVAFDWMQVSSVSNGPCGSDCVVNVTHPFRTTFKNNHRPSTLAFSLVKDYVHDVALRCNGGKITSSQPQTDTPGVAVGVIRGAIVDSCVVDIPNGQALYSYRSSDVVFRNNRVIRSGYAASEFAATVDLSLEGNSFGAEESSAAPSPAGCSAALSIDFGTAFFNMSGNRLINGSDIMLEILYGVHDGVITGNTSGWTGTRGLQVGQGVSAIGTQHILLTGNVFSGGTAGAGNIGVSFADFSSPVPGSAPISSEGNVISNNIIASYASPYGKLLGGDSYVDFVNGSKFSGLGSPANGSTIYCSDCRVASPLLCVNVTAVAACTCRDGGAGAIARHISDSWLCN